VGSILVRRQQVFLQDRLRDYSIFIDGVEQGRIANNSEIKVAIAAGKHTVQLKIDWCSSASLEINVVDGENVILDCGPNCKPWLALLYITFLRKSYLWIRLNT